MKLKAAKPKSIEVVKLWNSELYAAKIPMKFFAAGMKVRIIGNSAGHGFNYGTIVEVVRTEQRYDNYLCRGIDRYGNNDSWWAKAWDLEYVGRK